MSVRCFALRGMSLVAILVAISAGVVSPSDSGFGVGTGHPAYSHRRLTECTFETGLCSMWMQDTDDTSDWTLGSEGTPTSFTGPSTGSGGEGSYFFMETSSGQTGEAAISSSDTGCGLSIDYHMYGIGIGSLTVSSKNAADVEGAAWVPVWTKEGDQGNSWQATTAYSSSSSYYKVIATRRGPSNLSSWESKRGDIAIDNLTLLACTTAPTIAPIATPTTTPTTTPISAPTIPTAAPTLAPTAAPTDSPTIDVNNILNWVELEATCSASACSIANRWLHYHSER
jgi:hypothetical protein